MSSKETQEDIRASLMKAKRQVLEEIAREEDDQKRTRGRDHYPFLLVNEDEGCLPKGKLCSWGRISIQNLPPIDSSQERFFDRLY